MVRVASLCESEILKKKNESATGCSTKNTLSQLRSYEKANVCFICLRLVEDSDGLRPSLRGVQGVAAGVPRRELVITQEDEAGTGFRLERPGEARAADGVWPDSLRPKTPTIFNQPFSPRRDPGQLIGWVEYSAGCEGVGGAGVGHTFTGVICSCRENGQTHG